MIFEKGFDLIKKIIHELDKTKFMDYFWMPNQVKFSN